MSRYRRRAYSLIVILRLMPLFAAVSSMAWLLAVQVIKVQGHEQQRVQADTVIRDVVRRIQEDARQANVARINVNNTGELTLELPEQQVVYHSQGEHLMRCCSKAETAPVVYDWTLPKTHIAFRIETVGDSRAIIWITVVHQVPVDMGPPLSWQLSAAALVGQGGMP